jgi:hypothetical protein
MQLFRRARDRQYGVKRRRFVGPQYPLRALKTTKVGLLRDTDRPRRAPAAHDSVGPYPSTGPGFSGTVAIRASIRARPPVGCAMWLAGSRGGFVLSSDPGDSAPLRPSSGATCVPRVRTQRAGHEQFSRTQCDRGSRAGLGDPCPAPRARHDAALPALWRGHVVDRGAGAAKATPPVAQRCLIGVCSGAAFFGPVARHL